MPWQLILKITHIIVSTLLIAAILLQTPEKGLSGLFGGGGEIFHARRGAEKVLFVATIVLGVLFAVTSSLNFFLG